MKTRIVQLVWYAILILILQSLTTVPLLAQNTVGSNGKESNPLDIKPANSSGMESSKNDKNGSKNSKLDTKASKGPRAPKVHTVKFDAFGDTFIDFSNVTIGHKDVLEIEILNFNKFHHDFELKTVSKEHIYPGDKISDDKVTFSTFAATLDEQLASQLSNSILIKKNQDKSTINTLEGELFKATTDLLEREIEKDDLKQKIEAAKWRKMEMSKLQLLIDNTGKAIRTKEALQKKDGIKDEELEKIEGEIARLDGIKDSLNLAMNLHIINAKGNDDARLLDVASDTILGVQKEIKNLNTQIANSGSKLQELKSNSKNSDLALGEFRERVRKYGIAIAEMNRVNRVHRALVRIIESKEELELMKTDMKQALSMILFDVEVEDELGASHIESRCTGLLNACTMAFDSLLQAYEDLTEEQKIGQASTVRTKLQAEREKFDAMAWDQQVEHIILISKEILVASNRKIIQIRCNEDNADYMDIVFKGTPKPNTEKSLGANTFSGSVLVDIKGGLKIDVQPGVFFTFGIPRYEYEFEKVDTDKSKVKCNVIDEGIDAVAPSSGLLATFYKRSPNDFKVGGVFGISTDVKRINYFAGACLLLGRSSRIGISGGIAFTRATKPTVQYEAGRVMDIPLSSQPKEVPLMANAPFKAGGFLGLTISLRGSSKNNENIVKLVKDGFGE